MSEKLVAAPNHEVFELFLARIAACPDHDPGQYRLITSVEDITRSWKPIIVLNGGSHDPHIRNMHNHPFRAALVTRMEVLREFTGSLRLHRPDRGTVLPSRFHLARRLQEVPS